MAVLSLEQSEERLLGIDFGTTNCVVSVYLDGEAHVIPIDGANVFPTAVLFEVDPENEDKLITTFGAEAKEALAIYPESTVLSVKRKLGSGKKIDIEVAGNVYSFTPEEVSGEIFRYLREKAAEYMLTELDMPMEFLGCVITVPANSTDKQKKMTKEAAVLGGFDEGQVYLRLEPAAAAISYALDETEDKNVLVYDFGGGTFDACVLKVEMDGAEPVISILSTYGENDLGGNDVDRIIMDMVYESFKEQTGGGIDLFDESGTPSQMRQKKVAIARLEQVARLTKERLSAAKSAKITLAPFLQEPTIVNINMEITQEDFMNHKRVNRMGDTKEQFERYQGKNLKDMIDITLKCIDDCVAGAGLTTGIDEIFLVGGSSSLALVAEAIEAKFNKAPIKSKISPALSISMGAASYGNLILAPETVEGPRVKEKTIHPLGIEVAGRRFEEIIGAGIDIPKEGLTIESETPFTTNFDHITSMAIVVYEDTAPAEDKSINRTGMKRLAGTSLRGIPKAAKGEEKVKISFTVNQDNMLKVRAVSTSDGGVTTELAVDELY